MGRIYLESGIEDLSKWKSSDQPHGLNVERLYKLGSKDCLYGECVAMFQYETAYLHVDLHHGAIDIPFGIISSDQRSKWAQDVGAQNDNKVVFVVNTHDGLMAIAIWDFSVRIGPLESIILRG